MSKSIPLKEIVGFLPYGLNLIAWHKEKEQRTVKMVAIDSEENFYYKDNEPTFYVSALHEEHNMRGNYGILEIKPIVRPLSDLTKEIAHNGKNFVPLKYLHQEVFNCEWPEFEIDFQTLDIMVNCPEEFYISFQDIKLMLEKLHEWHFDIYDWIKDGLAVDLNTL